MASFEARQDRSMSWLVQKAWRLAYGEIADFPGMNDVGSLEDFDANDV